MNLPRILITPGEPAGIGPDVTVQIAQKNWDAEIIAIADPQVLQDRAALLGLPLTLIEITPNDKSGLAPHKPGTLKVMPVKTAQPVKPGELNVLNAEYVLRTLELATRTCLQNQAQAIVTGPVHKGIMQEAGIAFSGHTEFFAQQSGVPQTVMMFVTDEMKVALATTHIPLSFVSSSLSKEYLRKVIEVLHADLQKRFHLENPRIGVCGINPHAGEHGHLGLEEMETMTPLLEEMRAQGYQLDGPHPADTMFIAKRIRDYDVILAMYHDQALPVVKHIAFDRAVNVTLGLPFVRTSVDHGTALEIVGTGEVDTGSMNAALKLAIELAR